MIVMQDYGWSQLARRQGLSWPDATGWAMALAVRAGFDGWEPFVHTAEDARRIGNLCRENALAMPSIFLSGILHERADATLDRMAEAALAAAMFGTHMVVVFPAALQDKTDWQLDLQNRNLTDLAVRLQYSGIKLLYHPEEPEMSGNAREFHHVLARTDRALIRLCLDPDTIWRGLGRSLQAVLDVMELYGDRIDALHIRQSQGGIWAESVGTGDIDYTAIARALVTRPLLVAEHAYSEETALTLDPVTAHQHSLAYIRRVFGTDARIGGKFGAAPE